MNLWQQNTVFTVGYKKSNIYWLLAIGGNLQSEVGPPELTLNRAVSMLNGVSEAGGSTLNGIKMTVTRVSRFFSTPCFPEGAGPDYVNAALVVESNLNAPDLLEHLHSIEAELGRRRSTRWAGRTLDIDLIGCEGLVVPDMETYARWRDLPLEQQMQETPDQLILPHPRFQDRAFVLVPLNDVAPDWIHPVSGLTVREMLAELPESDRKAVRPL